MRRAKRSGATGIRRGLETVGEKLRRRELVYALDWVVQDDRVARKLKTTEWLKKKGMKDGRCRFVAQTKLLRTCVW